MDEILRVSLIKF